MPMEYFEGFHFTLIKELDEKGRQLVCRDQVEVPRGSGQAWSLVYHSLFSTTWKPPGLEALDRKKRRGAEGRGRDWGKGLDFGGRILGQA